MPSIRGIALAAAAAAALAPAATARAASGPAPTPTPVVGVPYGRIVRALEQDPVYVAQGSPLATSIDASELRQRIRASGAAPLYVAILPAVPGLTASEMARRLQATAGGGVFAVTLGEDFAGGGGPPDGVLQQAVQAMSENQASAQGAIDDFISRVGALRRGADPNAATGTPAATAAPASGSGTSTAVIAAIAVVVLLALGGGGLLIARRRPGKR